jgi:hypothetical protein
MLFVVDARQGSFLESFFVNLLQVERLTYLDC